MPGDVTVQKPGARIVGLEGKDEVPVRRQQRHITSRGVVEVQLDQWIPVWLVRLCQYCKIVAM